MADPDGGVLTRLGAKAYPGMFAIVDPDEVERVQGYAWRPHKAGDRFYYHGHPERQGSHGSHASSHPGRHSNRAGTLV